jgi:pimeloyl-ACP methyl ester carboxylesterase
MASGEVMIERVESVDERIKVADGLDLRVLIRRPVSGTAEGPSYLLVHGLASNARLWDGVAHRLAAAG